MGGFLAAQVGATALLEIAFLCLPGEFGTNLSLYVRIRLYSDSRLGLREGAVSPAPTECAAAIPIAIVSNRIVLPNYRCKYVVENLRFSSWLVKCHRG
jgi:hypothetical protein